MLLKIKMCREISGDYLNRNSAMNMTKTVDYRGMDSAGECCDSLARRLLTSPSSLSCSQLQVEARSSLLEVLQLNRCHKQESSDGKNELPEKKPLNNITEEFSSSCAYREQGVSHNLTMTDTNSDAELKDVWKCGYLRMLKPSKNRFFVLRGPSNTGPSRLECYDNEKKFKYGIKSCSKPRRVSGSPKNIIYLHQCFTVSKRADSKHRHLIALYTKDEYFAMVAKSEEEQEDWCLALNELMIEEKKDHSDTDKLDDGYWTISPGTTFKEVWQVIVKPKGLGQTNNLTGLCRLCLSAKTIRLVKLNSDMPSVNLPLVNVRRCGHLESFFFVEVGRSSSTGPGEIWMQVDPGDPLVAQKMHETILEAMKALRTIPDFRPRSVSQSFQSNPCSVIHARRHPHGNLPPSQTGLQHSSRSRTVVGKLSPKGSKGNEEVCAFQVSSNSTPDLQCNSTLLEENSIADYVVMDPSVTAVARTNEEQRYTMKTSTSEYENPLSSNTRFLNLHGQSKVAVKDGYMSMTPGLLPDVDDIASEFCVPPTRPETPDAAVFPPNQACSQDYMLMLSPSRSPAKDSLHDIKCSQSDEYVNMSLWSTVEDQTEGFTEALKSHSSSCAPLNFNQTCFQTNSEYGDYTPMCHPVGHPCSDVGWNSRQPLCSSPCRTSHSNCNIGLNVSDVSVFNMTGLSFERQGLWDERTLRIPACQLSNVALEVKRGQSVTTVNKDNTSLSLPVHISPSCPVFYAGTELSEPAGQSTTTRHWLYLCLPFCINTDGSE
ncbi:hypothetical protein UPYG_G00115330 [Umbra pygmaea]|uniref:Insulin receptor substrate 2 n=1 Tax=Umbra pygmaea TaxID=75934 RepID=A0ABD0X3M5_UMBPY